jgi:GT2 family glycosyltransferase
MRIVIRETAMDGTESCRLSVIIPTYRRGDDLLETLDSVMPCLGPNDELLIVDQLPSHSSDVARRILDWTRDNRVRLWELPEASVTLARNFGGRKARAPVLVFLDDDVTITSGFFERHLAYYGSDDVHAVAGHVKGFRYFDKPGRFVDKANGCNMSVRRATFDRVGGFDLNFQGNFQGEEYEFMERLRLAGGQIANGRDCPLIHRASRNGGCANRSRDMRWYRYAIQNQLYWILKRPIRRKLVRTHAHLYSIWLSYVPGGHQWLKPRFWRQALLPAAWTSVKLALCGAKPPFWPAPALLATRPMVAGDTTRGAAADRTRPWARLHAA